MQYQCNATRQIQQVLTNPPNTSRLFLDPYSWIRKHKYHQYHHRNLLDGSTNTSLVIHNNQQSTINNQQSTINNQQSTINNQQSTINITTTILLPSSPLTCVSQTLSTQTRYTASPPTHAENVLMSPVGSWITNQECANDHIHHEVAECTLWFDCTVIEVFRLV
jgi:hypothetical protein